MPAKRLKPRQAAPTDGEPHPVDPEAADFARRMDRIEKWTRILCVIGGIVFAILAIASLVSLLGSHTGFGRHSLYAIFVFGLLAAVCLARGLKGEGADLNVLDHVPGFRRPWFR